MWKCIETKYAYCISPLTMLELFRRLTTCDESHFHENRESLRAMYGPSSKRRFLRFPGHFLLVNILGESKKNHLFEPEDFSLWVRATLRAANLTELQEGKVDLGDKSCTFGMNLEKIEKQHLTGIDEHVKLLTDFRDGKFIAPPDSNKWAHGILESLHDDASAQKCMRASNSLDAAYRYDRALLNMAKNKNYDFSKKSSDWIDFQQLFYLADPSVLFVTEDKHFKNRTSGTVQANQIVSFDKFSAQMR
jgi:hypothetical protein